jgi:hypothetical protein
MTGMLPAMTRMVPSVGPPWQMLYPPKGSRGYAKHEPRAASDLAPHFDVPAQEARVLERNREAEPVPGPARAVSAL